MTVGRTYTTDPTNYPFFTNSLQPVDIVSGGIGIVQTVNSQQSTSPDGAT